MSWVDFKAVKAAVSFSQVLSHYGLQGLKQNGDELRGRCPIHKGGDGSDSFHINVSKGAFQCFNCKARGNVLDFVSKMESCTVRDAAEKLAEWFWVGESDARSENGTPKPAAAETPAPVVQSEKGETVNKPLTFQLRGVDSSHPYLAGRGISRELAEKFGCGFFPGKGSMSGRVVIPIHNQRGELVAYAGRSVDGAEPKYKLPAGFHKSLELFNLHRAMGEENKRRMVVVVEGFFDGMKVSAAGFPCVTLMGCSMSEAQERLLVAQFKAVWVMLDGDEAGRTAAAEIGGRLQRSLWVRQAVVPDGKQPDSMGEEELRQVLK